MFGASPTWPLLNARVTKFLQVGMGLFQAVEGLFRSPALLASAFDQHPCQATDDDVQKHFHRVVGFLDAGQLQLQEQVGGIEQRPDESNRDPTPRAEPERR